MAYNFDYFSKQVKQKPDLLPIVIHWIEYLSSGFCQRQAKGKTEIEFASIVLLTREKNLAPEIVQFLIKNIYALLKDNRSEIIQKALNQIANSSTPNVVQALKILKPILYIPVQTASSSRSLFSWFKKTKNPLEEETITSSSDEQTIVASGKQKHETFASSNPNSEQTLISSKPNRVEKKFVDALEYEAMEVSPAFQQGRQLSFVQKLTSQWKSAKVKTILSTHSPLEDIELETLRMQTIVSLNKTTSVLMWCPIPKEEELRSCKAENFFKLLQGISVREDATLSAKALLTQLKNSLTIRNKLLTDLQIIPNILHQGIRSWNHTLDRLSDLTNDRKINKKIWEYLQHVSHVKITETADVFRRKFLDCSSSEELDSLLERYSPTKNVVKKYPALGLIVALRKIKACYDSDPAGIIRYMNKYLGVYGEANIKEKLSRLLVTNESDVAIAKEIQGASTLKALHEKLVKLQQRTAIAPYTQKIQTLIQTFLDPNQHLAFSQFGVSLNSFSPAIRHKITNLVRQAIQKELNEKIQALYQDKSSSPLSRLLELHKILENSRYNDPMIQIYTYTTKVALEKLQNIKPSNDPGLAQLTKHIFSNPLVPKEFLELVVEGKKSQSRAR